ncbi:uncharacterized protein LOC124789716 [Schistocerca piceifrons]|uniref:uncharacterized protein LOC124789716 n=1 Tax=Schistocerca piceifrons TaxID=274613 RepID=UPI001F5EC651|nr:uncharacterized protein LOC124789716 [Schistocerca piceifrons]
MSRKWRLVKDEENAAFYSHCRELQDQASILIGKLQSILRELRRLDIQKSKPRTAYNKHDKEDVEIQALQIAVDLLQKLSGKFQSLSYQKQPAESAKKEEAEAEVAKERKPSPSGSTDTNTSTSSVSHRKRKPPPPPPPQPKVSRAVFVYKAEYWQRRLHTVRITVLYLLHQVVVATMAHCCDVAQQNHGQRTLSNMLRLASLYNDLLSLPSADRISVATICRNTCPILYHPLRKLSITKLIQILAQHRAERSCYSLVYTLMHSYQAHDHSGLVTGDEMTSPEQTENSSLEVYRALAKHITPPTIGFIPPGSTTVQQILVLPGGNMSAMERLLEIEEEHVATLLAVAAFSVPQMLGSRGIKPSKSSGLPKVTKEVHTKVVEYYQEILWGEVGQVSEHVALWWGPSALGVFPVEHTQQFRAWLHKVQLAGSVPQPLTAAVQSLMDGLCCHITSASWDQNFRMTVIRRKKDLEHIIYQSNQPQGTHTGQMYSDMLHGLVALSNECESNAEWAMGAPVEELPLVEQIPVLHRLDHSVHTTRLWALANARRLASAWDVAKFFLVSQADIALCMRKLQELHFAEHKDLSSVSSEHVMVCAKMRAKLVSEVRSNIEKLKQVPDECISVLASVCRTISLANLHMCFPEAKYWRQSRSMPKAASPYVEIYLDNVLKPVLKAMSPLPMTVQQHVGAMVMRILCEAWLDHIYIHRIKFSEWGAVQLLMDFAAIPTWLEQQKDVSSSIQHYLMKHEVLRRCEGVGRLLLRRPGEPIPMVEHKTRSRQVPESPNGSNASEAMDTLPAEMYVPNQEQWLELRAPRSKGLSLCCSS